MGYPHPFSMPESSEERTDMVHTFQCLGVNVAVDVNSGAVHVLDELTYHLLDRKSVV